MKIFSYLAVILAGIVAAPFAIVAALLLLAAALTAVSVVLAFIPWIILLFICGGVLYMAYLFAKSLE